METTESTEGWRDPKAEHALRRVALSQGFNGWLGLELIGAGNGRCEIALRPSDDQRQHHGFVHGGILGTLADTAASWAAAAVAGDVVTSSYSLQLLGPAQGDRLRAVGHVLKQGRRTISVEARVYDEGSSDRPEAPGTAATQTERSAAAPLPAADRTPGRLVAIALAQIAVLGSRSNA